MVTLYRTTNRRFPLTLGPKIGSGRSANIFAIQNETNFVTKVYHRPPDAVQIAKFAAMVDNQPRNPGELVGHVTFTWPTALLYDGDGRCLGFEMPRVDFTTRSRLDQLYTPQGRQVMPHFTWQDLLRTARSLAGVMAALHHRGYIIGDVTESNLLVSSRAMVTKIDCDSIQIPAPQLRTVIRCETGQPDTTPPELQGSDFSRIDREPEQDYFGLAILIFRLLMEGIHPFDMHVKHRRRPTITDYIRAGISPYADLPDYQPPKDAPPLDLLPPELDHLFARCFGPGHQNPAVRPTAQAWQEALTTAENHLTNCPVNRQHVYPPHLAECPWCQRQKKLRMDPFPEPPLQKPLPAVKLGSEVDLAEQKLAPDGTSSTVGIGRTLWRVCLGILFLLLVGGLIFAARTWGPSLTIETSDVEPVAQATIEAQQATATAQSEQVMATFQAIQTADAVVSQGITPPQPGDEARQAESIIPTVTTNPLDPPTPTTPPSLPTPTPVITPLYPPGPYPAMDLVIVLDSSGSMEFDPICYGCWDRVVQPETTAQDIPPWSSYYTYPQNGIIYPIGFSGPNPEAIGFDHPAVQKACDPNPSPEEAVYTEANYHYIIIEAEFYSRNNSVIDSKLYREGKSYWALQRGEGNYGDEEQPYLPSTGYSIDARGAHMAYHPALTSYGGAAYGRHLSLEQTQNGEAPWLEYDFDFRQEINWDSSEAYIWLRLHSGQGLDTQQNSLYGSPSNIDAYWAIIAEVDNGALVMDAPDFNAHSVKPIQALTGPQAINQIDDSLSWHWIRLTDPVPVDPEQVYRLYLYAGSPGLSVDRITITDNPGPLPNTFDQPPHYADPQGQPQMTAGSAARAACDRCNPIYGENITDPAAQCSFAQLTEPINFAFDPIFQDWEMPLRTIKEGVKQFVQRLDPADIQVGLVSFNQNVTLKTELECLKRYGAELCASSAYGYSQVLKDVESIYAMTSTNLGAGMKAGLEVLGFNIYNESNALGITCNGSSCAQGSEAKPIMLLITDGIPNQTPNGPCQTDGPSWPGELVNSQPADLNCPLYFAQKAAEAGVQVYVIGLGYAIDETYLQEVARTGNGQYYFIADGADLNTVLEALFPPIDNEQTPP